MPCPRAVFPLLVVAIVNFTPTVHSDDTSHQLDYHLTITRKLLYPDGLPKESIVISGQSPGPTIRVPLNSYFNVTITNGLSEPTSVHWHGITLEGLEYGNFYDGVADVTQCGIPPDESFTYRLKATNPGTHWYHSHYSGQREDGLYGALIVEDDPSIKPIGMPPFHGEATMLLSDLWHVKDYHEREQIYLTDVHNTFCFHSMLCNGKWVYNCTDRPRDPDGLVVCNSTLFPYYCPPQEYSHNYDIINVEPSAQQGNSEFRIRIVGAAGGLTMMFMIDEHNFTIYASDGNWVEPHPVTSLVVSPGETFDIGVVPKKNENRNFWIRATNWKVPLGLAILNYHKNNTDIPITKLQDDWYGGWEKSQMYGIKNNKVYPQCTSCDAPFELKRMDLGLQMNNRWWVINDKIFNTSDYTKPTVFGGQDEPELVFKRNTIVRWKIENPGEWWHPMHLHGHFMYLLGNSAKYALSGGHAPDVNSSWFYLRRKEQIAKEDGIKIDIPLNTINPPMKHTINVPAYGYSVVQVNMSNPGAWMFHCHVDMHLTNGLGIVFSVEPYNKEPPDYPLLKECWKWKKGSSSKKVVRWLLASSGFVGFVITFIVAIVFFTLGYKERKGTREETELSSDLLKDNENL